MYENSCPGSYSGIVFFFFLWNATIYNGLHITQYILEYDEGKDEGFVEVFKSRGKQHNLTKLQASTCYKFRLAAVNEYGKRYVVV
jgi:hypothetical protein